MGDEMRDDHLIFGDDMGEYGLSREDIEFMTVLCEEIDSWFD